MGRGPVMEGMHAYFEQVQICCQFVQLLKYSLHLQYIQITNSCETDCVCWASDVCVLVVLLEVGFQCTHFAPKLQAAVHG